MNPRAIFLVLFLLLLVGHPLAAGEAENRVIAATFKLFSPDSTSTCFLVRAADGAKALCLVTTAHSLERVKGETALLVLRKKREDGRYERLDHRIRVRDGDKPKWTKHPEEDVAVLVLEEPLPVPAGELPMAAISDGPRMAAEGLDTFSNILLLVYPHRFEANKSAFPVARRAMIAGHPFLPAMEKRYLAEFEAFAGDSGGPAFVVGKCGEPMLVGMVVARFHHDEKLKSDLEERTIRHPLGLGSIVYPEFIRETVVAATKQD